MSAKNCDTHNRFRDKTIAFRVSSEEDKQINTVVELSGMTKQDYIAVYQGAPQMFLYALAHKMRTEQTPCRRKQAGRGYVFSARKADGRA